MNDLTAKSSIFSILIIIFGLIGVIGVFLAWLDAGFGFTMSGWEIIRETINDPSLNMSDYEYLKWMPLITLIFSLIAMIIGLLALLKPKKEIGAGALAAGIVVAIAAALFLFQFPIDDVMGAGVYIALVSGILMIVGGALRVTVND
jgi:hypothetical protein